MVTSRMRVTLLGLTGITPERYRFEVKREQDTDVIEKRFDPVIKVTREQLLSRKILKPSNSAKCMFVDATECIHPQQYIADRGGRTFWFTCTRCGTRWPRTEFEKLNG